jgi:predicted metal-dependent hydrolase
MPTIQGDGFTVSVVKSDRRKTTALKIKDGQVSIHIPKRLPIAIARHFVQQKTPWIQQKLQQLSQQPLFERHFISGESLFYLGNSFKLQVISAERKTTTIKTAQTIEVHGRIEKLSPAAIRGALVTWYKQQAELYLGSQTAFLANKTGFSPKSITIKTYKARWGSCAISGDIQYNWKLILAPPNIVDYVIIHELCHLQQHNHSAAFWQLVSRHYPDFKAAQLWLKKNGVLLDL